MSKLVRVDPEAEAEIADAIDRYERAREGLGLEFRRKLLARFPYAVIFVELESTVRVLAVMYGGRRPAYWRRRLSVRDSK